ncbi:MAG TPA: carboxypeptidase-like regulatory domain-containing protein, partial [Candidatus Angelobacter sp.]|nr:carboxypeptidase-like regulatory domain-containing protein [Candidatus Angelobacter sp.]
GLTPNTMSGTVLDPQGAVISGARVKVTSLAHGSSQSATTDSVGRWVVYGVPTGDVSMEISSQGFQSASIRGTSHESGRSEDYGPVKLYVGEASTTVEVTSAAPLIDTTQSSVTTTFGGNNEFSTNGLRGERDDKKQRRQQQAQNQASSNVYNLQKKVSGVLPVGIDVPRAGNSYHFERALVLDEETRLTFNYKSEVKLAKK